MSNVELNRRMNEHSDGIEGALRTCAVQMGTNPESLKVGNESLTDVWLNGYAWIHSVSDSEATEELLRRYEAGEPLWTEE